MTLEGQQTPVEEPFIFTTIRYDPRLVESAENTAASCNTPCPFYMLEHHYTRLQVAKWGTSLYKDASTRSITSSPSYLLQGLLNAVKQWESRNQHEKPPGGLRLKLRNYASGRISTEVWPLTSLPLRNLFPTSFDPPPEPDETLWTVCLDAQPTEPNETTMFKTNDRSSYGRARASAGILSLSVAREVLLFSPEGNVIDASISTPYFYRNGRWVTPSSSSGGQQGTTRRWALEQGLCVEEPVSISTLKHGEPMWLSNAVRGYIKATFVVRTSPFTDPEKTDCDNIARSIC